MVAQGSRAMRLAARRPLEQDPAQLAQGQACCRSPGQGTGGAGLLQGLVARHAPILADSCSTMVASSATYIVDLLVAFDDADYVVRVVRRANQNLDTRGIMHNGQGSNRKSKRTKANSRKKNNR